MKKKYDEMNDIFKSCGISLSNRQADQFARYYDLITEYNDSLDLTRLKSFADITIKHFVDSIYFTKYVELPLAMIDIGTGAGLPGIPLKIVCPRLYLILAEPRKKRASFLELVAGELGISDIEIYPHMVTDKSFFSVEGAITRALEPINDTLDRVSHFLGRNGRVFFMKGPEADADMRAVSDKNLNAFSMELDRKYTLPFTKYERRIIVYKKTASMTRKIYYIRKDLTSSAGIAVTSVDNRKFKELKKYTSSDETRKTGMVLISGKKIISEIFQKKSMRAVNLILYDGYAEDDDYMNDIIGDLDGRRSLIIIKKSLFNEIDLFKTRGPLLLAEAPILKEWDMSVEDGCTLLVPFQDPSNVGAAIRSAAGFNVKKIIILREAAHPYHPKAIRTSSGAVFNVNILKGPSIHELPDKLNDRSAVVALDRRGEALSSFHFPERFLLLPGIEGPGLPETFKDRSVSIPLAAGIESLNATVAVSIALYEWSRRHSPLN